MTAPNRRWLPAIVGLIWKRWFVEPVLVEFIWTRQQGKRIRDSHDDI